VRYEVVFDVLLLLSSQVLYTTVTGIAAHSAKGILPFSFTTMSLRQRCAMALMELLGTLGLVCTIQVSSGALLQPLAVGGVLTALVYAGGPISGAHYNPAVSFSVLLRGKSNVHQWMVYTVAQWVGGVCGAWLGGIILHGDTHAVSMGEDATLVQALVSEIFFTFLLCFVILTVATKSDVTDNNYFGVSIGLVVLVGAISVGPISGGAFNPAVALGLSMVHGADTLAYALQVSLANWTGGALAALAFWLVAPDEFPSRVASTNGERTPLV